MQNKLPMSVFKGACSKIFGKLNSSKLTDRVTFHTNIRNYHPWYTV